MSFPLKALRELLAQPTIIDGVVVSVETSKVHVATSKGLVVASFVDKLAVQDRVRIDGGMAYPLNAPTRTYSV